jgi:hypothetical protein
MSASRYVAVDVSDCNADTLFCPACGKLIFEKFTMASQPCPHVLFVCIDVGELMDKMRCVYKAPRVRSKLTAKLLQNKQAILDKCPDTAIIFNYESSGQACTTITMVVAVGIDFPEFAVSETQLQSRSIGSV